MPVWVTAAGPAASMDGMLYLNGADYVTIDGLTFYGR